MKNMGWRLSLVALLVLGGQTADAKIEHLLPKPQSVVAQKSAEPFALNREVAIEAPDENAALDRFLTENGCMLSDGAAAKITVTYVDAIDGANVQNLAGFPDEAYTLTISGDRIAITAVSPTGVTRAAQTLTQLAEGYEGTPALEALSLTDWPAFKLRGVMHDVGRSFITVDEIKKEIDLLSRFKVNVFHWHLTENQAWRFEVKAYPQLTSAASMTRFAGKFYTQEECAEVERYAAERGVMVIPEIDMPGHSEAFERAMGHSMQTDEGVAELKTILEEVAAVFPNAPYVHIGADEKAITYPGFLQIMTDKVHELGKKVVVWNPISGVTISKDAGFDMTQMWSSSGQVVSGMPNIDCRYNYVNHFDVFADVVGIYKSNIYYTQKGTDEVAGSITAVWNDRKTPTQEDIVRQNNFYANALATAERAWMGGGLQYIEAGGTVLPNSGEEFDAFADWEARFLFHKAHSLRDEPIPYVKQTNVHWCITDAFPNGGDADFVLPPETEGLKDSYVYEGKTYGTGTATGAGIYLRHTWGATIPTYFSQAQTGTTAYAWTYVYSPSEQTVGALIEFQNYGRSERDAAPEKGKWDRKGSRLWVNAEEVLPPVWENTGVSITNETDLRNENFTAREPTSVHLKEGWNKVFMKLPYNPDGLRLPKWMFTFVLTDLEGRDAVEGLIYSPNRCMDESAEQVAAAVSDAKRKRNAVVSDAVGFYPPAVAVGLDAVLAEIEPTLQEEGIAEDVRAKQLDDIARALSDFTAACAAAEVNQPKASTESEAYWYVMNTPARDGRYPTSKGAGAGITGETTATAASIWKFVSRSDGSFDIVNYSDGSYVSPVATNNTQLKTVASRPARGWTLKPAAESGCMIIVSGSTQFNQTNGGNGYKLFNWGGGTNTTDGGCQYSIIEKTDLPEEVELPEPLLTLTDLRLDGSRPYRVPDELAAPVLGARACTMAIDFTPNDVSSEMALVSSSDSTATDAFLAAVISSSAYGMRYNDGSGKYTLSASLGTQRHQVVVTMASSAPQYVYYLDGSFGRDVSAADCVPFGGVAGVNGLYIGGVVRSDQSNAYPLRATVHSVRFFPEALTAEQVAALSYNDIVPTSIGNLPADGSLIYVEGRRVFYGSEVSVYTLDGMRVSSGAALAPGVYICKSEGLSYKFLIR